MHPLANPISHWNRHINIWVFTQGQTRIFIDQNQSKHPLDYSTGEHFTHTYDYIFMVIYI